MCRAGRSEALAYEIGRLCACTGLGDLLGGAWRLLIADIDRCYEAIATSRNISHVSPAGLPVPQGSPQPSNLNPQIAFLDDGIGPDPAEELVLADKFARTLDEYSQNLERAAAQAYRGATFEQKLLCRHEAKGTERKAVFE
jgi:hypothetical protein